jgi:hypothetical protein
MSQRDHRLHIGGVEILLRARPEVIAGLLEPWPPGFGSAGGAPDLVLEYEGIDGWLREQPEGRGYPGYAITGREDGALSLARRDSEGTISAGPTGPVTARFRGNSQHFAIEAVLRVAISVALPRTGGLLLHAAGVASASRALVFTGPSGSGKSTMAGLLRDTDTYPRRLGDDLVAVRPANGGWKAMATPFAGEIGPAPEGEAPLAGVYFLVKSGRHVVQTLEPVDALRRLMRNVMCYVADRTAAGRTLEAASALCHQVPCGILEFARDPAVVHVL